jgi:3-oxoadipate enol-lactonase
MYTLHGDDRSKPLLLYVAGLDGTGELFFRQIPSLSESYRIATFRLREQSDVTYEELADDIAAIIDHTGERNATLVGESFGGAITLSFALRHPQMVERLVIVNSFPYYRRRYRINLAAFLATKLPAGLVIPFRFGSAFLGLTLDGVRRADRRKVFRALRTVDMKSYARRLQLIREVNLEDRLAEINAPALLIATSRDLLVPSIREAKAMAARMPNARVKIINGAGHACLLGGSVRLSEILAEWVAS